MDDFSLNKKAQKVMHHAEDSELDEAVYIWFVQQRSLGASVSGPVLCAKAVQLYDKLNGGETVPPFQASKGWLWRFCNCHGMRQLTMQGEKLSSDSTACEPFNEKLQQLIEQESLSLQQVYNCDETGLFYTECFQTRLLLS